MQKSLLFLIFICSLTACKKELDFDYNEVTPFVVIEGQVTNEGTDISITKSRSVTDSVTRYSLPGAVVTVTAGGASETIPYDPHTQRYHSAFKGKAGETYKLMVDFEGQHYEGTSTMPAAAPILSTEFLWFEVMGERMVVYEVWATDPLPTERNYYWWRMDRITHHPHFQNKPSTEPYRWSVFDNRGTPPGLLYRDVTCMSERVAEEDDEDNWKRILYEGDSIAFRLMSIDRSVYEFFTSLRSGQSGGANPYSNLTGGCQGYFTASSVTRSDTIVFRYDDIKSEPTFTSWRTEQ